uniref:Uncharacterized protein n=1 Tax=Plectus sambesii TaxID=2011161 RepID=A0A914VRE8_9BILA
MSVSSSYCRSCSGTHSRDQSPSTSNGSLSCCTRPRMRSARSKSVLHHRPASIASTPTSGRLVHPHLKQLSHEGDRPRSRSNPRLLERTKGIATSPTKSVLL